MRGGLIGPEDEGYAVTTTGDERLAALGIDLDDLRTGSRVLTRPCLDWTERRPHLAGALGAALASRLFELDWIRRRPDTRAIRITELGQRGLRTELAINL